MSLETIGQVIAILRREKGIIQEALAQHVGVSTQAVSKWENGGVPDTELLPRIADYFGVSIDRLFGRESVDYQNALHAVGDKLAGTSTEERFSAAMDICWTIEKALTGSYDPLKYPLDAVRHDIGKDGMSYSSIRSDYGFTLMGLGERLPYFLLLPDAPDKETAYFEGIDYTALFKDFSDKAVFDAMVFLYKREAHKAFTAKLLVQQLGIGEDKAVEVIHILQKYGILITTQIEMDDTLQEVYTCNPQPAFPAMLLFAQELIVQPNQYYYFSGGREKPYLA